MLSKSHREILHGYSVVRACLDDTSDHAVPVGVVAWDTPNRWQMWRWLAEDEKVRGIDPATRRLMRITRNQIQRWAYARKVPYEPAPAGTDERSVLEGCLRSPLHCRAARSA